ncbi:mechanosensitive ion channel family protein [Phycisphaerales bacterium AB-hyl4]|uniref:Mechanosensitive ion channel family protein n=1 Tax=Natronomicrosphaera hydrolytica TaxID=3242702 RepID=A0ABV4TZT3_9BACT
MAKPAARTRNLQATAQSRLRRFRRGSMLAVALTAMLLLLWGIEGPPLPGVDEAVAARAEADTPPADEPPTDDPAAAPGDTPTLPDDPAEAMGQATRTIRDLLFGAYVMLPRIFVAIVLLVTAAVVGKLVSMVLRRVLRSWSRADASAAMAQVLIWLIAVGAALSVLAGDARALIGSVGLAGLALSWALQAPIESFTGWLMNSFKAYYRIGDRIAVGDVFGDVYKVDILTTTVWEAGGPDKPVAGAQPTGAMITFPNSEVLRANIINYTREFPFVWDEVTVPVANESDLPYAIKVMEKMAGQVLGTAMAERADRYRQMLERARIAFDVEVEPSVFVSLEDSWTDLTIRYLVPARERRRWASLLQLQAAVELDKPEHRGRIIPGYPRANLRVWNDDGGTGSGGATS